RTRSARLPLRARAGLSGRVCQSLHILAAGPRRQPDLGPDLYLDRSAYRLRAQGRVMSQVQLQSQVEQVRHRARRPFLSPLNQRRWQNFKANRRGYWSLWIFLVLFVLSLFSEFIANDKPLLAQYKGELLF